jgi:hypothetical protein
LPLADYLVKCDIYANAHICPIAETAASSGQCKGQLPLCTSLMREVCTFLKWEASASVVARHDLLAVLYRVSFCLTLASLLLFTRSGGERAAGNAILIIEGEIRLCGHRLMYHLHGCKSCLSHTTPAVCSRLSLCFSKPDVHEPHSKNMRHFYPDPW